MNTIDTGTIDALMASARYAMVQANEVFRAALAAAVDVGHEVAAGEVTAADFEDGDREAQVYLRIARRYFDHPTFTKAEWDLVEGFYLQAVCDWLRLADPVTRPSTATWRLKNRLRKNPLAQLARLHLRGESAATCEDRP